MSSLDRTDTSVRVSVGAQARDLLDDPAFVSAWRELATNCAGATVFQTPDFACIWYDVYQRTCEPVLVWAGNPEGGLRCLWSLAFDPRQRVLMQAGAHHAEYQIWLASAEDSDEFIARAWECLSRRLPFDVLKLTYVPVVASAAALARLPALKGRVRMRVCRRPLLALDARELSVTRAKKGNRSRISRLNKCGVVEFVRVANVEDLARVLDELAVLYDFRQAALGHSSPFRDDPDKRRFHVALFANAPYRWCVTATLLDGKVIAAFWGARTAATVHLGILAYSPLLAEHSPGKLHLMDLSAHLVAASVGTLDLTPGGDPWKERFANRHDEVAELTLFRSPWRRRVADAVDAATSHARRWLRPTGITPAGIRAFRAKLGRIDVSAQLRRLAGWVSRRVEFRVYRVDRAFAQRFVRDERVRLDSLSDLLTFEPGESWQARDSFLADALSRLEAGDSACTIMIDDRLAHVGWISWYRKYSFMTEVRQTLALPEGSVALYDFYTHPDFRGRGLYRASIGHLLCEAFDRPATHFAYISVLADNEPSRHVIEELGFSYLGSFWNQRRFGIERAGGDAGSALMKVRDA